MLAILLSLSIAAGRQRELSIDERFSRYETGSDGSPRWHPVKGAWTISPNGYGQMSSADDRASVAGPYLTSSYEIEASFEWIDGELGACIIFSSKGAQSIADAQTIKFDAATAGGFLGRLNLLITITPGQGDSVNTRLEVFNGGHAKDWPSMNKALAA